MVNWEEPPQSARTSRRAGTRVITSELLSELAERPQQWARIAENIRAASISNWRKRHPTLEFMTAPSAVNQEGDRSYTVWARYVGEREKNDD